MIEQIYQIYLESSGICTDTRNLIQGNLFFALRGPNFNANEFAEPAIGKGAKAAVIDDPAFAIEGKTILVNDALKALQELASVHRDHINIPVIGITGSNGKTTTKELSEAVLNSHYRTFATRGNLNNHIGVPLSILSVNDKHQMAIIEMGANHVGEIAFLSSISRPTHGLITNIGKAHTGLFGGLEGVIRAKSELYDFLIKNNGTILVNQNQEILMNMSKRMSEPVFYPNPGGFYHCKMVAADPFVEIETEDGSRLNTQLIGAYNFENIATALCLGKLFDVPLEKAHAAVREYEPENNRSQIIRKGSTTIILDAYNANPSSMEKALENLSNMSSKYKVAIVGDMFELGDDTDYEHALVGSKMKELGLDDGYFCGKSMKLAYQKFQKGHYYQDKERLIKLLQESNFEQTTVLIKASRGMALEDIVDFL